MSDKQPFSGIVRLLGVGVTVAFVLVLTLYGVLTALSYSRSDQADRGWSTGLGTLEDVLERYPSRDCNAAAIELERVVARLGIDLSPRGLRDVPLEPVDAEAFGAVASDLGKYLDKELERASGRTRPPKDPVAEWLDAHADAIDAVVARLRTGDPPRWTLHLEHLYSARIPNLLAHLELQRVLGADALYRTQRGETAAALERLDAAWSLYQSLAGDPILATTSIAMSGLQVQIGVLRHVDASPTVWRKRVGGIRPLDLLAPALEFEGWTWNHLDDVIVLGNSNKLHRTFYTVTAPYVRLCAADVSERMRVEIERLRRLDYVCDRDLALQGADLAVHMPFWNRLGGMMAPSLTGAVHRAARLEIDLELTAQVLELRAQLAAGGAWSAAAARFEPSRACPSDRWDYRFDADDGLTIAFSRELGLPKVPGIELPTRFETGPRP